MGHLAIEGLSHWGPGGLCGARPGLWKDVSCGCAEGRGFTQGGPCRGGIHGGGEGAYIIVEADLRGLQ